MEPQSETLLGSWAWSSLEEYSPRMCELQSSEPWGKLSVGVQRAEDVTAGVKEVMGL